MARTPADRPTARRGAAQQRAAACSGGPVPEREPTWAPLPHRTTASAGRRNVVGYDRASGRGRAPAAQAPGATACAIARPAVRSTARTPAYHLPRSRPPGRPNHSLRDGSRPPVTFAHARNRAARGPCLDGTRTSVQAASRSSLAATTDSQETKKTARKLGCCCSDRGALDTRAVDRHEALHFTSSAASSTQLSRPRHHRLHKRRLHGSRPALCTGFHGWSRNSSV